MKKRLLLIILCFIILITTILSIFAANNNRVSFEILPDDIAEQLLIPYNTNDNIIKKMYLVINFNNVSIPNSETRLSIQYTYFADSQITSYTDIIISDNGSISTPLISQATYNSFIFMPYMSSTIVSLGNKTYYIPIFYRNAGILSVDNSYSGISISLYNSSTTGQDAEQDYFNLGYNLGYDNGYDVGLIDGAEFRQDLNLVEHIEQLIGTFTGYDFAHYITPIALVIVILFVYFLFIRLILSLLKAKNATKICDIVVLIGCVILLLVLYAPMLDLTIKNESVVETTSLEETVRLIREPITIISDETGEIMYGPVGTVKILYESISTENFEDLTESALSVIETTGG